MDIRHKLFLLAVFLVTAAGLPAATVRLAGYDTTGAVMAYGSGSNGNNIYYKPAVSDYPRVAFIAPDPMYAQGPAAEFRASYLVAPLEAAPKAALLFSGQKSFLGFSFSMPNWQIAGTPDLAADFAIRQGTDGGNYVQLLGANSGQAMELPPMITQESRLTISADGTTAAIGAQTGMLLVSITADELDSIDLADTPLADNTGYSIGLSANGDIVFFASNTLGGDGLTRIYRYTRSSAVLETVAVAEAASTALADAQVVATPDGNTAAFVATNYLLWSGSPGDGRGSQIIAATRQTNGDWIPTPCSIGPHLHASEPSISADGRFTAFRATTIDTGAAHQVFRHDRLTETTALASTAADGLPADAACEVPSIAPNGRYIAFVSKAANLGTAPDGHTHVWLSDLGPTLTGGTLALPEKSSAQLPIHLVNAKAGDTLAWSSDQPLPGAITWLDQGTARPVTANTPYPVDTLPWTFTAGPTPGDAAITLTLQPADNALNLKAAIALEVFATDIPRQLAVSTMKDGAFAQLGGLLNAFAGSLAEDGTLAAFATSVPLDPDQDWSGNDFDIYLRQLNDTTGELTLLTGALALPALSPALAGNGANVFFIAGSNLYSVPTAGGTPELLPDTNGVSAVAPSHDGTTLALVRDGEAWLRRDGQMTRLGDQTGFTKPMLSRDGQVAAFLDGDGRLFAWTAADNAWRRLAGDTRHVSMTLDGAALFSQTATDGSLNVIATGSGNGVALPLTGLPDGVTTNDLSLPTISPNRRFLVYFRIANDTSQLFRYELATDTEAMVSVSSGGQPGNGAAGAPLAISGAGDRILYATTATNLLPGKTGTGRELTLAVFTAQPGDAPALATPPAPATEAAQITFPLDGGSDFGAVVPVLLSQPQHGQAELIGPATDRDGYALRLTPYDPHFCGQDSVVIKLFDGSRWSSDITVNLTVENVNDMPTWATGIPTEATTHVLAEGQSLTGAPALRPYASDPDLAYAAITGEALSFSLAGAPDWLALDQDGRLATTAPPSYDIASRGVNDGQTVFDFSVRVTDLAGAFADLPV
ncbi:MAG: hypothetical protein PHC30_03620, partial [Lentisphaeria bacterium]|nr:hypothetical protein [Lentisphaeria bacterium]